MLAALCPNAAALLSNRLKAINAKASPARVLVFLYINQKSLYLRGFMFKQVLVPKEQNTMVTIPTEWIGMELEILVYPIAVKQPKEKKQFAWLSGNSKIDNPVRIGENFRKIPREELYERKSFH